MQKMEQVYMMYHTTKEAIALQGNHCSTSNFAKDHLDILGKSWIDETKIEISNTQVRLSDAASNKVQNGFRDTKNAFWRSDILRICLMMNGQKFLLFIIFVIYYLFVIAAKGGSLTFSTINLCVK